MKRPSSKTRTPKRPASTTASRSASIALYCLAWTCLTCLVAATGFQVWMSSLNLQRRLRRAQQPCYSVSSIRWRWRSTAHLCGCIVFVYCSGSGQRRGRRRSQLFGLVRAAGVRRSGVSPVFVFVVCSIERLVFCCLQRQKVEIESSDALFAYALLLCLCLSVFVSVFAC